MAAYSPVIHDSQKLQYRSPLGAQSVGTAVTLAVEADSSMGIYAAELRLWCDGAERLEPMKVNNISGRKLRCCVELLLPQEPCIVFYYFILHCAQGTVYYQNNALGLGGEGELLARCDPMRSFQITVYASGFQTPDWVKGAVMYQIFPDRFCKNGDFSVRSDCRKHENWDEPVDYLPDPQKGYYPANDFFGGTLAGIQSKLPYLHELGVEVLYLNPIFSAYSNHRYDCADYENVDPVLGTNEDFSKLCRAAKAFGIRVILDGVFSHTGSDSRYFNRNGTYPELGAYQSEKSPYYEWYSFNSFPDDYDCWWGVWSLPNVKETTPSYMDYMLDRKDSIVRRWIERGASGWRLDVADELPDEFLFCLRSAVKEKDPQALVIGEVWEDASNKVSYGSMRPFLLGNQLDSVMNYPLREALLRFLLGMEDAEVFVARIESLRENYPPQVFACLMNFISTHDVPRAVTVLSGAPQEGMSKTEQAQYRMTHEQSLLAEARCMLAAAVLFALPGMPCIYYGDEAGLSGYADPFNRAVYPWGRENRELLSWYKACGALRKNEALRMGELHLSGSGDYLCIRRKSGELECVLLLNRGEVPLEAMIDSCVFSAEKIYRIVLQSQPGAVLQRRENGYALLLPAMCAVFVCADPKEDGEE